MSGRLAATLTLIVVALLLRALVGALTRQRDGEPLRRSNASHRFWIGQGSRLLMLAVLVGGLLLIWFGERGDFATVAGLATAGVAVALQRVITSFAAYLIVLRGHVYTVGDRITIGGVRGDVVALGFMQTTVMEMGESPNSQSGNPQVWVAARQYTGRIVRVTNDRIFDTPVYNYTREFPYLWEEMAFGIKYDADYVVAERILLETADTHTREIVGDATPAWARLRARYLMAEQASLEPQVYLRMTDNWVELAVRFIAPVHGIRVLKSNMQRDILAAFAREGLEIASATYEIVGLPAIRVAHTSDISPEGNDDHNC